MANTRSTIGPLVAEYHQSSFEKYARGARRGQRGHHRRLRLLPGDGHAAAGDRLRPARFPVGLAAWLLGHDTDS